MPRNISILLLLIAGIAFFACEHSSQPGDGTVTLSVTDSSGARIVHALLTISENVNGDVRGKWEVLSLRDGIYFFNENRSGEFNGRADGKIVSLNLAPGWTDNNPVIYGSVAEGYYAGEMQWIGFDGPHHVGWFRLDLF
jgi:hypothetical protein